MTVRVPRIALLAILALSSCGTLDSTVDRAGDRTEAVVTHAVTEIRSLKTETLTEVRNTIEEVTPKVVDQVLNTEAVAFLIVTFTFLLALVVIVALLLLLGAARTAYKRWQHTLDCSARPQNKR